MQSNDSIGVHTSKREMLSSIYTVHVQFHRCGYYEFSQPTIQRRKASEGVGGNKLFIRLTVEVLDSEPTRCFRAALDQYLIGKLRIVGSVDELSL